MKAKVFFTGLSLVFAIVVAGCSGGAAKEDAQVNKDVVPAGQKAPNGLSLDQPTPAGGGGGGAASGPAAMGTNP